MNENIKVECKITNKRVPKVVENIPTNQWKVSINFTDVVESESTFEFFVHNEEGLEYTLASITVLENIKKRLSEDWNKYCNRGSGEFDDVIEELGLEDYVSSDTLMEYPNLYDYRDIMGRYSSCEIVYYDENGDDFICDIKIKE